MRRLPLCLSCLLLAGAAGTALAQPLPSRSYYVYACAESEDQVSLIRYGPDGGEQLKVIPVGSFPAETEGPHGINISPDGKYWFLSLAHGLPYGSVHRYRTGSDEWDGDVTLGLFPATLDVSAATGLMYVVNFNLHGPMEPSSISVVESGTMIEVARIPSGVMPHGARLNRQGTRLYSVNMMDDELVEVDALEFKIARRLPLSGHAPSHSRGTASQAAHHQASVQPSWVTRPSSSGTVYVAGNKSNTIFEVDLASWSIKRRFENTAAGPYNLALAPNQKTLLVTYKKAHEVGFWDLPSGRETSRLPTTRPVPHGVVVSPDGQYAFVTVEGKGGEPGTVEVYHVPTRQRVAAVEMGKQAGGIAFWKTDPPLAGR